MFTIKTHSIQIKKSLETKSPSRQLSAKAWGPNSRVHKRRSPDCEHREQGRANGIHDPDVLLIIDTRKSIHYGTKTVQDPNIKEARLRNKWCPNVSFLEYYGVALAIQCAFKTLKLRLPDHPNPKNILTLLNSSKKPSQLAYQIYRDKKCTCPEKSQAKWLRDCESEDVLNLNWRSIYLLPRKCTLSTKLRNFQFKLLHRRIATNSFLFKIKFSDTDLCCFCQNVQETPNSLVLGLSCDKCFLEKHTKFPDFS